MPKYLNTAIELLKKRELIKFFDRCSEHEVLPLLFKGTALAYSVYSRPEQRHRLDTDILIRKNEVTAVANILIELGYEEYEQLNIFNERQFFKTDTYGIQHVIDVHWHINNRKVVASLFSYDELFKGAVAVPALGTHALRVSDVDQVCITVIHEVFHHKAVFSDASLRDAYHILGRFNATQWENLFNVAAKKNIIFLLNHYLDLVSKKFSTEYPKKVFACNEFGRDWISNPPSIAKIWYLDFKHTLGARQKFCFLINLAFPSKVYKKYHRISTFHRMRTFIFRGLYGSRGIAFFKISSPLDKIEQHNNK